MSEETAASKLDKELEERRRATQRTIQQKVAELRAQGADAAAIASAVNRIKKGEQQKVYKLQNNYDRAEKGAKHQVIIIPVEWRRHEQETAVVDDVSASVKQALMSAGLDAWLDGRRQYTPGQKYAYWEHLGVKHRVEIGPEDLKKFTCRIVRADKPGAYLEHQRLNDVPLNPRAIVTALDSLGLKVNVDISLISDEPILKAAADAVTGATEEEQDWAGNVALSAGARAAQKKPRVFGPNRRSFQQKNQFRRPY